MEQSVFQWYVNPDATNDQAYAVLAQDPIWNCFALADLEPPLRASSQFAVACSDEGDACAVCLILRHPIIGEVISPFGKNEGVAAILQQVALPRNPLVQAQEAHVPLLQQHYRPQAEAGWKGLLRMAITSDAWQPPGRTSPRSIQQLTGKDLPALTNLYARHAEGTFSADLFPQGLYFGAYEDEQLIAAGGTHVLAPRHGLAVLGNILTSPRARRQGYATAITAALVTKLCEQRFSLVVLNVFADNWNAIRIYQRLGFQTRHRLVAGKALLLEKVG